MATTLARLLLLLSTASSCICLSSCHTWFESSKQSQKALDAFEPFTFSTAWIKARRAQSWRSCFHMWFIYRSRSQSVTNAPEMRFSPTQSLRTKEWLSKDWQKKSGWSLEREEVAEVTARDRLWGAIWKIYCCQLFDSIKPASSSLRSSRDFLALNAYSSDWKQVGTNMMIWQVFTTWFWRHRQRRCWGNNKKKSQYKRTKGVPDLWLYTCLHVLSFVREGKYAKTYCARGSARTLVVNITRKSKFLSNWMKMEGVWKLCSINFDMTQEGHMGASSWWSVQVDPPLRLVFHSLVPIQACAVGDVSWQWVLLLALDGFPEVWNSRFEQFHIVFWLCSISIYVS